MFEVLEVPPEAIGGLGAKHPELEKFWFFLNNLVLGFFFDKNYCFLEFLIKIRLIRNLAA